MSSVEGYVHEFITEKLEQQVLATDPSLIEYEKGQRLRCSNYLGISSVVSKKVSEVSSCVCALKTNKKKPYEKLECPNVNSTICWNLFIQEMKARE